LEQIFHIVWMRKVGYMEMFYFTHEAYQLREYQQEENESI